MSTLAAPEVRTYPALQLRVEDVDANTGLTELHGRAVPYDTVINVGWYAEKVRAGAFDKSLTEAARGLPLLLFHDNQSFPIGRSTSWKSSSAGLDGVWQLDDSPEAQRAARQARDGYLIGMSIGFSPVRDEWDYVSDEEWDPSAGVVDTVERIEARLLETSLTPTPAYAGAQVELVRSATRPARVRARAGGGPAPQVTRWRGILDELRLP